MQKPTSSKRKSRRLFAFLGLAALAFAAAFAVSTSGLTPTQAAHFAQQPDTQIAVFLVPVTLLLAMMLFEATRFVRRGALPAPAPARRAKPTDWANPSHR